MNRINRLLDRPAVWAIASVACTVAAIFYPYPGL